MLIYKNLLFKCQELSSSGTVNVKTNGTQKPILDNEAEETRTGQMKQKKPVLDK